MKNWTIRSRIAVSFAVILVLMIVVASVAYTRLMRIEQLTNGIEAHILPGLDYSKQIAADRTANYLLTKQYALQNDAPIKQELHAAILASREHTTTLLAQFAATIRTPEERRLFETFTSLRDVYVLAQDKHLSTELASKSPALIDGVDADLYQAFAEAQSAAAALVANTR